MAEEAPPTSGRRCALILDNASWHKVKTINWHHLEPVDLPPESPNFNPIERLWQHLKSHSLEGFITKRGEELTTKRITSIQTLLNRPQVVRSVWIT